MSQDSYSIISWLVCCNLGDYLIVYQNTQQLLERKYRFLICGRLMIFMLIIRTSSLSQGHAYSYNICSGISQLATLTNTKFQPILCFCQIQILKRRKGKLLLITKVFVGKLEQEFLVWWWRALRRFQLRNHHFVNAAGQVLWCFSWILSVVCLN